jgi:hypothetical protein
MKKNYLGSISFGSVSFFLVFVALIFVLRTLWTYPIEHGDAVQKYFYAAGILKSGDWSLLLHNHHTMRWTSILPQIGITWLFGTRYQVFYILPLLMFSLCFVLILFSLKNILSRHLLLILAIFLFLEPLTFTTSNQLLNPPFAIFFALAGSIVLTRQTKAQNLSVIVSACLFFVAYGAHVTYLSLAAGGFFWLAFVQRKPSKALIFSATIMVLIGIEVLMFNYLSDWQLTMGRLEALAQGRHVERIHDLRPAVSFIHLLTRWADLPLPDILVSVGFLMAGPWLFLQKKKGRDIPDLIIGIYLVALCFAVSVTFAVISINPIKPAMAIRPMYLIPFLPFAAMLSTFLLAEADDKTQNLIGNQSKLSITLIFLFVVVIWSATKLGYFRDAFDSFVWKANGEYTAYSEAFQRGELILTGKRKTVYSMIARFNNPVDVQHTKTGISVINPLL